jgi:hypothetical protein
MVLLLRAMNDVLGDAVKSRNVLHNLLFRRRKASSRSGDVSGYGHEGGFPAGKTYRKFRKHMVSESYKVTKMKISMR